jgi:hypothetical protein
MRTLLKPCVFGVILAALLFAGCAQTPISPAPGDQPQAAAKPAAPPQVVAAKTAFAPMYTAARAWASDVVMLRVTAKELPGFKNSAGMAGQWEAVFASPSLRQYRTFTYSIANVPPDTFKGVVAGLAMPWAGVTRDVMPVDLDEFSVDSDVVYKAAAADAADWLKKNPDKPLSTFEMGDTYKFQTPVWYVVWGSKKSGYATFVDASSGKVVKHG